MLDSFYNNLIAEDRYRMILDGLQVTLVITVCAVIVGTILGGLVCWMRMSRRAWLQKVAKVYIDIMRGTPVLVVLMLMYYVIMAPLEATGVVVAIVTFGMNTAAYRPITVRITYNEMSAVTALDFMVENLEQTPLTEAQRNALSSVCVQVVEEPTGRGYRIKLIL